MNWTDNILKFSSTAVEQVLRALPCSLVHVCVSNPRLAVTDPVSQQYLPIYREKLYCPVPASLHAEFDHLAPQRHAL